MKHVQREISSLRRKAADIAAERHEPVGPERKKPRRSGVI
jgi:hypothetical protein